VPALLALCASAAAQATPASMFLSASAQQQLGGVVRSADGGYDNGDASEAGLTRVLIKASAGSRGTAPHVDVDRGNGSIFCSPDPDCGVTGGSPRASSVLGIDLDTAKLRGVSSAGAGFGIDTHDLEEMGSGASGGFIDQIKVHGGSLDLQLGMSAQWGASVSRGFDNEDSFGGEAGLSSSMTLRHLVCTPQDGCNMENIATLGFTAVALDHPGPNRTNGMFFRWLGEPRHDNASSIDEMRVLHLTGLSDGEVFELEAHATFGTHCIGPCGAIANFGHTADFGLVGDFVSLGGVGYRDLTASAGGGGGSAVPQPPTLPLVLAGIAAAAVLSVRRLPARA